MLTEKGYCDYDTCVALKELGYNEKSNWWFNKFLNEDSGQMELVHICDNPAHLNYDSWGIVPKDFVIRPSLYEAQKWLREEKKIHIEVYACARGYIYELCKAYEPTTFSGGTTIYIPYDVDNPKLNDAGRYDSYEDALLEGIKEAIKTLKEEK